MRELVGAFRSLRRTPTFTAVAIISLTLAVGANTAVFTLLNALVWRDVAVRDPQSLVQLSTINQAGQEGGVSWPAFQEFRRQRDVFSSTIGWISSGAYTTETSSGINQAALTGVSGEFFSELGVVPAAGRLIGTGDIDVDRDVASPVVVIGWSFWQRMYGGSPSAVGQELRVEGVPLTIVGVAPKDFKGLRLIVEPDVIVPLSLVPLLSGAELAMKQGGSRWIQVTGRLRPGVTLEQARAQLLAMWPPLLQSTMAPTVAGAQRDAFLAMRLLVSSGARGVERPLRERFTRPLFVVLGIALVIALITAVNLSGLAYARAGARAYEFRLRLALGAGRGRIRRAAAAEGALIGAASATLSVLLASYASARVSALILSDFIVPVSLDVSPDARVIAVAAILAVGIGVLMAVVPAWGIGRDRLEALVQSGSRTVARSGRAGRMLLTAQVALSVVLLVGSTLLVQSLYRIATTDVGLRSGGVLVGYPSPRAGAYRGVDPETYYQQTLARIEAIPGVEAAAFTQFKPAGGALPPSPVWRAGVSIDEGGELQAMATQVSPGFFEALGIAVLHGRPFMWTDTVRSRRVAILSESLATRLFGSGSGIGQRVRIGLRPDLQDLEVVGIVSDARVYDVRSANLFMAYTPSLQLGEDANWKALVVRAPESSLRAVQQVMDAIGVELLPKLESLDYITSRTVLTERMLAMLAAYFGGLAIVLAAIGIHGQTSYTVSMQRKEIGVRMALGATTMRIVRWIVGSGAIVGVVGGAIGLVLAVPAVRVLQALLVNTSAYDGFAFTAAPALLLVAIVVACLAPALRATTIDPMVELRRN